ncbi:MAG TPA: hypothetical protein VIK95_13240 [Egibacteraceae bacterium]
MSSPATSDQTTESVLDTTTADAEATTPETPQDSVTEAPEAGSTPAETPSAEGDTAPADAREAAADDTAAPAETDAAQPDEEARDPQTATVEEPQAAEEQPQEAAEQPQAETADEPQTEAAEPQAETAEQPRAEAAPQAEAKAEAAPKKKKQESKRPEIRPEDVVRRIGDTNDKALRYVLNPDPKLSRLSRKVREQLLTELPPVTAGALLGPDALARHFVASAASGRYRDLFSLWELFRARPDDCKPVLAERPKALQRGREALEKAVRLGLMGHAERVAEDIELAQGLIWQWLRDILLSDLKAVGRRPLIAAALLRRDPTIEIPLPSEPSDEWLAEAAAARQAGPLPQPLDTLLGAHVERLPATVATLQLVQENYPDRVGELLDRVDLDSPEIQAIVAWARDHGHGDRLRQRIRAAVEDAAAADRADGLAQWYAWHERGIELPLPEPLRQHTIDDLDLTRPETGELLARLTADGADLDPQGRLDALASQNRQLAEKAYESFVCAGLDVVLPAALVGNPIVKDGTRCPYCAAWTWVRPGHERRCPRRPADAPQREAAEAEPVAAPAAPAPAPAAVDPAAEWEAQLRGEQQ